jgi:hypothetical protein
MDKTVIQAAYMQYWDIVKDKVDEEGWVYTKNLPHLTDFYFEESTGKPIEFQKSFGPSGSNPHWMTKGSRWRPKELGIKPVAADLVTYAKMMAEKGIEGGSGEPDFDFLD